MCGRYTLHRSREQLAEALGIALSDAFEHSPDYNIAPGRAVLALQKNGLTEMHWGLRTPQNFHVNARLETADSTPRFRDSWTAQRCLIPANGFYEWLKDGVRKQPHYISTVSKELMYFGALWFESKQSEFSAHCVILTTEAQDSIQEIHHRMPVCIPQVAHSEWFNHSMDTQRAAQITQDLTLEFCPVSNRVNSVHNNDSSLVNATPLQGDDQMQFF